MGLKVKLKQLIKYLPIASMVTCVGLATLATPPIFTKSDTYNNQSSLNSETNQLSTEADNSAPIEYIKNDVAKQTGVTDSIASIELADKPGVARHSAAIVTKHDGSTLLYMWGPNNYGQLGTIGGDNKTPTPVNTSKFTSPIIKQVALGYDHSAALLDDGSLYTWGRNDSGQLGTIGGDNKTPTPVNTSNFTSPIVKQVALGAFHSAALLDDGSLYTWGNNGSGELGTIGGDNKTPTPVNTSKFTSPIVEQVSLGGDHSAAILDDGSLYMWGRNFEGQLGTIGGDNKTPKPVNTSNFTSPIVKQVSLGSEHSAAILDDGSLYTWGDNTYGQLGTIGGDNKTPTPVNTSNFTSPIVKQLALGRYHSAAILNDGSLYTWGWNNYGQLGNGKNPGREEYSATPIPILASQNVIQIALGEYHCAALLENEHFYTWGHNTNGELGNGTINNANVPTLLNLGKDSNITAKSSLTAEQAVNNSWVGKFDLDGFKQSFNLINIPDVPGQTITMVSKPIPNIKDGSVDIKIKIKYFYDENGLKIPDNTEIPLTVTGFRIPFINSSITLKTSYMNPTYYESTAKQLESSIKSAALDAKITLLENYIDINLEKQLDGSPSTIKSISTTPPINKNGELEVTFNLDNFYENEILVSSKTIPITNLRKTSTIIRKSSYATETAKFLTSQFINNLKKQNSTSEFETFLKPYLDIDFPVQGSLHNNQASITSAIPKETTNGTIELVVQLADYYDDITSNPVAELKFTLDGFIKTSSIKPQNDYAAAAAVKTVNSLINDLTASNDYKTLLSPYLEFNFNTSSTITSVTTTNTTAADNANGIFKFSLGLANYYEIDKQVTSKDFTLIGFKIPFVDSSIKLKTSYMNPTDYGFTAKQLESNLKSAALDAKIARLKHYINFDLKDQPEGSKAAITAISTTSPVNKSGELLVTFALENFYENRTPVTSKTISIINLRKTSSIIRKSSYATETAKLLTSQFITNLENQKAPAELKAFLTPYLDMDFPTQGSSHNKQASITSTTAKETTNGTIELVVQLANYYDDITSNPVAELKFTLDGFIKTSSIEYKNDYAAAAAAKTVHNLISDLTTSNDYKNLLSPYLEFNFNTSSTITSATAANTTAADKANGILKFSLGLDNYYEVDNQVTSKDFTLNGFIRTSSITQKTVPTNDAKNISAKQLATSLDENYSSDQYKAILEPFLDFRLATQPISNKSATIISVVTSSIEDTSSSLTIIIGLKDFYGDNGTVTSLLFNLTGFKSFGTNQTSESGISWWIYVGIGVGVLLLLIVFILLIKKHKRKDKKIF